MNGKIIVLLMIFSITGCTWQKNVRDKINPNFNIPVIVQDKTVKDTVEYFEADSLNECYAVYYGKFKFKDTLYLSTSANHKDLQSDMIMDYPFIDNKSKIDDTLKTDGLQIFTDYNSTITFNSIADFKVRKYYYPVYIVNETSRTKIISLKQDWAYGLQEAQDSQDNNFWKPIESKRMDWCGSNSFGLKIHQGEFVLILFPKYQGTIKSLMRVRMSIGENVYVSRPFLGSFNYNQFYLRKRSSYWWAKNDKNEIVRVVFNGAIPKDYKEW